MQKVKELLAEDSDSPDDIIMLDWNYLEIKDSIHTRGFEYWKGSRKIFFMDAHEYKNYIKTPVGQPAKKKQRSESTNDEEEAASLESDDSETYTYSMILNTVSSR